MPRLILAAGRATFACSTHVKETSSRSADGRYLLVFVSLLLATAAEASRPAVRHYDLRDGLPQSQVRAVIQDRSGFLWVGTLTGGLGRYDGRHWRVYDSLSGLPGASVSALALDERGTLFAGTWGGAARLEADGFRPLLAGGEPLRRRVTALLTVPGGAVLLGSGAGVLEWTADDRPLTEFPPLDELGGAEVTALVRDSAGTVYAGTSRGLGRLDRTPPTASSPSPAFRPGASWPFSPATAGLCSSRWRTRGSSRVCPGPFGAWATSRRPGRASCRSRPSATIPTCSGSAPIGEAPTAVVRAGSSPSPRRRACRTTGSTRSTRTARASCGSAPTPPSPSGARRRSSASTSPKASRPTLPCSAWRRAATERSGSRSGTAGWSACRGTGPRGASRRRTAFPMGGWST